MPDYDILIIGSSAAVLIDAAKAVLNCRTRDLLKQNGPSLPFLPSEDVSQWPEGLRRKMERGEAAREDEEREV